MHKLGNELTADDKKYQQKLRELNEGKVARNILELRKIIYLNL